MDGVTIIIIEDEEIVVSASGGDNESSGLVGANVAGDGTAIGVDCVGTELGLLDGWSNRGIFGGADVGALGVHVAHGGSFRTRRILGDLFGC